MYSIEQIPANSLQDSKQRFDWQSMGDWRLVLPPSRPSEEHIEFVRTAAKGLRKDACVAVLGSTVEYRDLLKRLGFVDIFVFDKNPEFFDFSCKLSTEKLSECYVEGDWLDTLSQYESRFDLVLSHLTTGNVRFDRRMDFFSGVARCLRDRGRFVDFVLTNETGYLRLEEIERKYRRRAVHIASANSFSCHAIFCSELVEEFQAVDTNRIYEQLYEVLDPKLAPLIDLAQSVTPMGGYWYYGRPWELELTERRKFFDLDVATAEAAWSPYADRAQHQVLVSNGGKNEQL